MSKTRYVVGFLFDNNGNQIVLLQKTHPEWQAGMFNGVGGKVEDDESPLRAMRRECEEEIGVEATWELFYVGEYEDHEIYFYRSFHDGDYMRATSQTDELVYKRRVDALESEMSHSRVHGLEWLIPMALDRKEPGVKYEGATNEGA